MQIVQHDNMIENFKNDKLPCLHDSADRSTDSWLPKLPGTGATIQNPKVPRDPGGIPNSHTHRPTDPLTL